MTWAEFDRSLAKLREVYKRYRRRPRVPGRRLAVLMSQMIAERKLDEARIARKEET